MMRRIVTVILCLLLSCCLLASCGDPIDLSGATTPVTDASGNPAKPDPVIGDLSDGTVEDALADLSGMDFTFSLRDKKKDYDSVYTRIKLSNGESTVRGSGATVKGTDVTITDPGVYVISGSPTSGSITVEVPKVEKVQLVLKGLHLSNPKGPAIFIKSAEKVFLTLVEGTENTLSDGTLCLEMDGTTELDAALFSREDLTINGAGKLTVNGNYKHGILSRDDLLITGGDITVNAKNVGLNGKDCVKIGGGTISVTAGTDGIRSDNIEDPTRGFVYLANGTVSVTAARDAIQAETAVCIDGGTHTLHTTGGRGIKAALDVRVTGGSVTVDAKDDAIHSNATVYVTGGNLRLTSEDDAIHADTALGIANGQVTVASSYEALESTQVVISGGTVNLKATDDGINAAGGAEGSANDAFVAATGSVTVSGGYLSICSSGDGIGSNGTILVSGGVTLLSCGTGANVRPLDASMGAVVRGGTLLAVSANEAIPTPTLVENQGLATLTLSEQQALGVSLALCKADGTLLGCFIPSVAYRSVMVSVAGLTVGESYRLLLGGSAEGADPNGYAFGVTYTSGTEARAFTLTSLTEIQ